MFAEKISSLRKSQKVFPPVESDQAGNQGEQVAFENLKYLQKQLNCHSQIFRSLRVPKQKGVGKYEIDLLLVSQKAILVIEVKNWSGHLARRNTTWVQERRGEAKILPDPLQLNREKQQALAAWLSSRGIDVADHCIHSIVLLTHPKVTLDAELKKQPDLATLISLAVTTQIKCGLPKSKFLTKKPSFGYDYKKVIAALGQLPTWDCIRLHGGRLVFGDLENIVIPGVKATDLQRKKVRGMAVQITRRLFPGLFLPARIQVRDWAGSGTSYPLHPKSRIIVRLAGQNEIQEFSCLHVESLRLGWKDDSYYRSARK